MATTNQQIQAIVFDLNGTFYRESSKDEFYKFICSKRPKRLKYIFEMGYYKLLRKLHQISQTEFKENFFDYLNDLSHDQVETYAREFWQKEYPANFNKELYTHFVAMRKKGIKLFCATGGLELYVRPLFELFEVDGFAGTRVTYTHHTYIVQGKACKKEEKVRRLEEHFKGQPYRVIEAYSDSKEAILTLAEKAFLVHNGDITLY